MLVDGEVMARNLAANKLHRAGYMVLAAAHSKEALEIVRTYDGRIDLLIADMNTPRTDGTELCTTVTAERPDIRTCLMSARASDHDPASGSPFLLKPIDEEMLRKHFPELV